MFDIKIVFSTFIMVFLAELGDKTQLATMGFAAESKSMWSVFVGSALALCLSSALAVLAGAWLAKHVSPETVRLTAGGLFVVLGIWMLAFSGR
ncbi:MAG: TMEM165/GDT1 family protein [Desulfatibacillum sp.]|nr:TMEM165/GDT1 family protein [Desulfatibacillum sp.]